MLTPRVPMPPIPLDWYGLSKLANICFAEALKRRLAGRAYASVLSPGSVYTKNWGGAQEILKEHQIVMWMGQPEVAGRYTLESAFASAGFEPGEVLYAFWFP